MDTLSRLAGPANLASGTSTVFTVPTGHTYTLKNITLVNTGVSDSTVSLGIGGTTAADLIGESLLLDASGGFAVFNGIITLNETETLQANASQSGITCTISGLDQS